MPQSLHGSVSGHHSNFRRPRGMKTASSLVSILTLLLVTSRRTAAAPLESCQTCQANEGRLHVRPAAHHVQKRQTFGTDTIYTTSTTTVIVRPNGVTPLTTTTRTATVTLPGGAVDDPDPIDSALRIVTATVTLTEAVPVEYTLTERVTVTLPAEVVPVPITRTLLSTSTSTATSSQRVTQTVDNGGGRNEAAQAQETGIPFDYTCRPGDANEKYPGGMNIEATDNQRVTLYLIGIYIIGILVAWNLIGFRTLLYPVKMLVVAYHEFWHILIGVCLGQKLEKVDLAPELGGKTVFNAPEPPEISLQPFACYFAAMVGNALLGSLLVFCGFNTLASKIASFFIGLSYAAILWYASAVLALALTAAWIGLMIGFWFINHGLYLKYYVLFIGVMTALYFIWDIMDDFIFRKVHPCCPRQLENRFRTEAGPRFFSSMWSGIWAVISIFFFVGFILLAVAVFRQTPHGRWTVLSRAGEALVVVELLAIFRDVSGQKDKDGRQLPAEKALFARSPVSQSTRPTLRQRAQNGWKQVV